MVTENGCNYCFAEIIQKQMTFDCPYGYTTVHEFSLAAIMGKTLTSFHFNTSHRS